MFKWPRKPDIEGLGLKMGLDVSKFKLKSKLIAAIQRDIRYARYVECYNDKDPVTLESLHLIDDARYVQWTQHGLMFGADSVSIRELFANGLFMHPFALEIKTWKPNCDFDLRKVDTLSRYCGELDSVPRLSEGMSFTTWIFREIDRLCDNESGYVYGQVKNLLVDEPSVKRAHVKIKRALRTTLRSVVSSSDESDRWIPDALVGAVIVPFANVRVDGSTQQLLIDFVHSLQLFKDTIGSKANAIIFLIFNDIK
jgi:hypothetical protein